MAKYKIIHFKKDCISCGACAAINPAFWEMDQEGLAELKGSTKVDDHHELDIDEKDKESNQEAAEVCPVNIIHLKKIEDKN
ncbi:MAG: ferredoxin [Nanoarchaeota archaeon]